MADEPAKVANRVVVGVDGSAPSMEALRWAQRIAAMTGATIDAVMTWNYSAGFGLGYLPDNWNPSLDAEKALAEAVDGAYGAHRPDGLRLSVREGGAAQLLIEESQDAVMLVVGSRGLGGFSGLLLGSVSTKCAEHAGCPVLVVHGPSEN